MPQQKVLRIELYGGLGNQILIYLAGLALSKASNRALEIDFFWKDSNHSKEFDVTSMNLSGEILRRDLGPFTRKLIKTSSRVKDSLSYRSSMYRRFEYSILGIYRESQSTPDSREQVLEKLISSQKKRLILKGYFFSSAYFLKLIESGSSVLSMNSPSVSYKTLKNEASDSNPVGIHVRKWENPLDFGQLSEQYFLRALSRIRKSGKVQRSPIWLFVENKDDLLDFPQLSQMASKILTPDKLCDPAETLFLMSMCRKLIISNSTFSYCAALLSDKRNEIYVPWPFRPNADGVTEHEILLSHWKPIEAEWHHT